MPYELKLDEFGHVVVVDGMPVYIDYENDREIEFDYSATLATIDRLNKEKEARCARYEATARAIAIEALALTAIAALRTLDGIDDPTATHKALAAVKVLEELGLNVPMAADAANPNGPDGPGSDQ